MINFNIEITATLDVQSIGDIIRDYFQKEHPDMEVQSVEYIIGYKPDTDSYIDRGDGVRILTGAKIKMTKKASCTNRVLYDPYADR